MFLTDIVNPVISGMPDNIEKKTDEGKATTMVDWAIKPSATDNSGSLTLASSHSLGELFRIGVTTVIYTAVDSSGNKATKRFTVTVKG